MPTSHSGLPTPLAHKGHSLLPQVYDASAPEQGAGPANYAVVAEAAAWWEVPLEGAGAPDNPVPGPNGEVFVPGAAEAVAPAPAAAAPLAANGIGISDEFLAEGGVSLPAAGAADAGLNAPSSSIDGEHPAQACGRRGGAQGTRHSCCC